LIEIRGDSNIEKILKECQIAGKDDVLVYEITEDDYAALEELFIKS